ncbi:MAG TPA: sulfotransferase [Candidatus Micrarchaeia archaeon]|nr:sulfotransferase [Candidatus Micrarchaeia archaeon]
MYENGGNVVHRLLDGHPDLFVYPFESQLGTAYVSDHLTSVFPAKYRWPSFRLDATPSDDYRAIIDEECRVRANTPAVSKFRHVEFDFSDAVRSQHYLQLMEGLPRSRPHNVHAFLRATMMAWRNRLGTSPDPVIVGYSPIITVDSTTILSEVPEAQFVHVVRNPWSAYADTKKRPIPLPLAHYVFGWVTTQLAALHAVRTFPNRVHVVRFEDVVREPIEVLGRICSALGLNPAASLATPTWNGAALPEVFPWGTIRTPTEEQNRATAAELSRAECAAIAARADPLLATFGYQAFLDTPAAPVQG